METPASARFLETLKTLYETAGLPAAVMDGDFNVLWCSARARELQPCLNLPDGARSLLRQYDPDGVKAEIAARGSFTTPAEENFFGERSLIVCALPETEGLYLLQPSPNPLQGTGVRPEGISRTLSAFSSQYRAPLTVIFSMLSLLQRSVSQLRSDKERGLAAGYLEMINENAYRLLRSCQWINCYTLFVHGLSPVKLRQADLFQALRELCTAAAQVVEPSGIPMSWDIPAGTLACACDLEKLAVVLLNLLSNSCRFSRPGNRISVRVRKRAGLVSVSVSDRGAGIPADIQPRVFEPYFSYGEIGQPFAGNGLGLACVKDLTAAMGGTVTLTSTEGKGTTVVFTLPLRQDPSAPPALECSAADYLQNRFSMVHVALADSIRPPM